MKVSLLIIDPQNDFCDPNGALFVPGANDDMQRLSKWMQKSQLDEIYVTLDSHHLFDVAHPLFWQNSKGENPAPFTIITASMVKNGEWMPTVPALTDRMTDYVETLENNSRYPLCIWPPHCLIGSWGHGIVKELYSALLEWEKDLVMVNYVAKGANPYTEHYSAIKADVPKIETSLFSIVKVKTTFSPSHTFDKSTDFVNSRSIFENEKIASLS